MNPAYEAVIGLEIHAQLQTESKLFNSDGTAFGAPPNTQVGAITLGHPGTLPRLNRRAVEFAIRMGLACNCRIMNNSFFARKHYFYPDLSKAFQTTQHTHPICLNGQVVIHPAGGTRAVRMHHIHLEEDAGKSIHNAADAYTSVDYNRAGVPLIEIVSEPDLYSAEEAYLYFSEIRRLVQWLGICDGNLEEGSMRCDVNISLRRKGDTTLGTKVEIKNLNSLRNMRKAIEVETQRLSDLLDKGEAVIQQTRSFDAATDTTFALREKEEANDYRYFPEPDLPPIHFSDDFLQQITEAMPALPQQLQTDLETQYGLSAYDAALLCQDRPTATYFLAAAGHTTNYKAVANWINGPLRSYLNEARTGFDTLALQPQQLADLITLVESGQANFSVASARVFPAMLGSAQTALEVATTLNVLQVNDTAELAQWVSEALAALPDKVAEYKKGKKGLIGLFVGEVKKRSKGKADPRLVTEMLEQKLKQ